MLEENEDKGEEEEEEEEERGMGVSIKTANNIENKRSKLQSTTKL